MLVGQGRAACCYAVWLKHYDSQASLPNDRSNLHSQSHYVNFQLLPSLREHLCGAFSFSRQLFNCPPPFKLQEADLILDLALLLTIGLWEFGTTPWFKIQNLAFILFFYPPDPSSISFPVPLCPFPTSFLLDHLMSLIFCPIMSFSHLTPSRDLNCVFLVFATLS